MLLSVAASGLIVGLFSATTATGLSGASPLSAIAPKISPPFISKVQNVCEGLTAAESKFGSFPYPTFDGTDPQPGLLKKVGKFFDQALPVERSVPGMLRALGEPAAGVATWHELRWQVDQYMKFAEEQAIDATAGNAKRFVAAVKGLSAVQKHINSLAKAGGFSTTSPCLIFFG